MGKVLTLKMPLFTILLFLSLLCFNVNGQTRSTKYKKSPAIVVSAKSSNYKKPEIPGWYSGYILSCHHCPDTVCNFAELMGKNNIDLTSVLTKKGCNFYSYKVDSLKKSGKSLNEQDPEKIVHMDAEWYSEEVAKKNQQIVSHFALLGLDEILPTNENLSNKILEFAKKQNSVTGFVPLNFNGLEVNASNCCLPLDYPVETALGNIDFIAEGSSPNDASIRAYYKLLNCGFKIGLATQTDCKSLNKTSGNVLTYVQVREKPLTYEKWIEGIKNGRTVISLDGHNEFLDLRANGINTPGDEIRIKGQGDVNVLVRWVASKELTGRIELLCNGKVVVSQAGTARPGSSVILTATQKFIRSGWLSARRVDENGYVSHTAPIYVSVDDQPIRASIDDAKYFITWIDHVLGNISAGGPWYNYFGQDLNVIKQRYEKARDIYIKIEDETIDQLKKMGDGVLDNGSVSKSPVKKPVKRTTKHKKRSSIKR